MTRKNKYWALFILLLICLNSCKVSNPISLDSWNKETMKFVYANCPMDKMKEETLISYNELGLKVKNKVFKTIDEHLYSILNERKRLIDFIIDNGLLRENKELKIIEFHGKSTSYIIKNEDLTYKSLQFDQNGRSILKEVRTFENWFCVEPYCIENVQIVVTSIEITNILGNVDGEIMYNTIGINVF